ncbi:hypothetical protein L204_103474 [Cryptococcus depauperatus]
MVQFTILAAMVGMPMLVLASPLTKTFAGGFRQAILSTGGSGVANDHLLFDSEQSTDDNLVVEAGRWGFKYLTGLDAEKIDITEATMASKDWDALMDNSAYNPITILTNKTPVNGIEPNQYYTVCSKSGDNHITVWKSTILEPSINAFSEVTSEDLRKSTRSLYHLKNWVHL